MTIDLDLQRATSFGPVPHKSDFLSWLKPALQKRERAELTIRLVDLEESRQLNARYRGIDKPTNVLSFPAELPAGVGIPLLGDIVICAPLVTREAAERNIAPRDHWAHLTVHGLLHLLGYDHQNQADARLMEGLESSLLDELGIPDPYQRE